MKYEKTKSEKLMMKVTMLGRCGPGILAQFIRFLKLVVHLPHQVAFSGIITFTKKFCILCSLFFKCQAETGHIFFFELSLNLLSKIPQSFACYICAVFLNV